MRKQHWSIFAFVISCIALVLSLISIVLVLGDRSQKTDSNEGSSIESVQDQDSNEENTKVNSSKMYLSNSVLDADLTLVIEEGSWHIGVDQAFIDGDVLGIEMVVTNNTAEASSNYISVKLDAYQQGIQLAEDFASESEINQGGKIQPGASVTIHKRYRMNSDTDDILVELSYLGSPSEGPDASATWKLS